MAGQRICLIEINSGGFRLLTKLGTTGVHNVFKVVLRMGAGVRAEAKRAFLTVERPDA